MVQALRARYEHGSKAAHGRILNELTAVLVATNRQIARQPNNGQGNCKEVAAVLLYLPARHGHCVGTKKPEAPSPARSGSVDFPG